MNRTRFLPGASAAAISAAFPRGPRIAFAPEGGAGAAEFKMVTDEVKSFAEKAVSEFQRLGSLTEAHQRAAEAIDTRMTLLEQKAARRGGGGAAALPSLGQAVIESEAFKSLAGTSTQRGQVRIESDRVALETKNITTATGSGGALLAPDFRPDVVALPYRRLAIRDLVAPGETAANAVTYPVMASRTNNAAMVAEGNLKPQSDLGFNLVTAPTRTLAHFFVGSRQMLDDAPALRSLIDTEARYGLRLQEDAQMLYGDGQGQDLLGIMPQAQAFTPPWKSAGDTAIDVLIQAIAQVEAADYECDGLVLNMVDWLQMTAIKDGQGRYLSAGPFGPAESRRLWDLPVAGTNQMPRGSFLVGGFKTGAQIFDRMAIEVMISTEHADFFVRNLIALRAEERLAFTVQRPGAFVTGKLPVMPGGSAP